MINAQHEDILESRIISIINNTGLTNQAKYLHEQLEPISITPDTLQSENSTVAHACQVLLKLLYNALLGPYQERFAIVLPKQDSISFSCILLAS